MAEDKQINVEKEGQLLAQVTVTAADENGEARAQVHMASGQLPAGTRQQVVDAVHEAVTEDDAQHLTATVPLGDAELVEGLRDHLHDVELRAAGATSIIDGDIPPKATDRPTR